MAQARRAEVYVEYRKKVLTQVIATSQQGQQGTGGFYDTYHGNSIHIDEVFADIGVEPQYIGNWKSRRPVAEANGIVNGYTGTYDQNVSLMNLAKAGQLKRVGGADSVMRVMKTSSSVEATDFLAPYAEKIDYTDAAEGQGDNVTIELNDREGKFLTSWMPEMGMFLYLRIITKNWMYDGARNEFECGEFLIDDISYSGPPAVCKMEGVSVPQDQDFRSAKLTRTWQGATLSGIVTEIANKYGLEVMFDAADIRIESIEQNGKADCAFLYTLCSAYGYAMKTYSNKLIVYDIEAYEKKDAVLTVGKKDCINYRFRNSVYGTYTGANVAFTDPNTEEDHSIMIGSEGRIYEVNITADNLADLEKKGIAALNLANRSATTASLSMFSVPGISAGQCINLSGFGTYDGRYFIDKIKHGISGNGRYTQTLTLHQIQEWIKSVSVSAVEQAEENAGKIISYTVKSGDTLWAIAKQHLGAGVKYAEIYSDNKETIESTAKSHGKSGSDNGHWIWPGEVLQIHVKEG